MKYGKLTYLRDVEPTKFDFIVRKKKPDRFAMWRCDCGKEKRIKYYDVTGGKTRSCGCEQGASWRGAIRGQVYGRVRRNQLGR